MGYGELPGQKNLPGALQVLVAGQSAGGAERDGGTWHAHWMTPATRDRSSVHATAEEAVAAVIRSGFARHLGARKASKVYWTPQAKRRAGGAR
jgi:hypothetical protein